MPKPHIPSLVVRRAAKPHICTVCGEVIPEGKRFARWLFGNRENFKTNEVHFSCLNILDEKEEWFETAPAKEIEEKLQHLLFRK